MYRNYRKSTSTLPIWKALLLTYARTSGGAQILGSETSPVDLDAFKIMACYGCKVVGWHFPYSGMNINNKLDSLDKYYPGELKQQINRYILELKSELERGRSQTDRHQNEEEVETPDQFTARPCSLFQSSTSNPADDRHKDVVMGGFR